MLPIKKSIKRDNFSALLISYVFNGTDILKFLGFLDESYILVNINFVYTILGFNFNDKKIQYTIH